MSYSYTRKSWTPFPLQLTCVNYVLEHQHLYSVNFWKSKGGYKLRAQSILTLVAAAAAKPRTQHISGECKL